MMKGKYMISNQSKQLASRFFWSVLAIALACALCGSSNAQTPASSEAPKASQTVQKGFATPQQAVDELLQASSQFDVAALTEMFGPKGQDLVSSADPVADKNRATSFAAKAREKNSLQTDPKNPNKVILVIGNEEWPWEVPLVKKNGKWYFDTEAGRREILIRRIGFNELDAITVCRGYVEAQMDYASEIHDDSGVNQYAQKIISIPGKHDGLSWQNPDGTWGGPVGEAVGKAVADGYKEKQPFHGYYFKLLKGQGPAARLGTMDYFVGGAMIGGFAIVAWPAEYRVTGVQTFIVSYDGVVYQKDLGPNTAKIAAEMERYNPDKTWHDTSDDW
jgi:hypothetical protein